MVITEKNVRIGSCAPPAQAHLVAAVYDGQIFAMAGASLQHNRITANLLSFIAPALRDRGCEAFGSDFRIQTPGGLFRYPDLSVVRGATLLIQARPDTLTDPIVLVEVFPDATREYDRGQKFTLYKKSLPSVNTCSSNKNRFWWKRSDGRPAAPGSLELVRTSTPPFFWNP